MTGQKRFKDYLRICAGCDEPFRTTTQKKPPGGYKCPKCTKDPDHCRYGGLKEKTDDE